MYIHDVSVQLLDGCRGEQGPIQMTRIFEELVQGALIFWSMHDSMVYSRRLGRQYDASLKHYIFLYLDVTLLAATRSKI